MVGSIYPALIALLALAAGLAIGLASFTLLARNLDLYLAGRAVAGIALQTARFLLLVAGLFAAVQFGALALLSCALGLLVGRHVVLRRHRQVR